MDIDSFESLPSLLFFNFLKSSHQNIKYNVSLKNRELVLNMGIKMKTSTKYRD